MLSGVGKWASEVGFCVKDVILAIQSGERILHRPHWTSFLNAFQFQAPLAVTIRRRCVHTFESRPPLGKWVFLKHDKDRMFCLKFSRKGLVYVERREQVRLHYFETAQLWVAQDSSVAIGRIDENHLEVGVNHKGKMQFSVARRLDGDYADAPPARVRAVKSPQSPSYPLFPPPLRPAGYWEVQDEWS